MHTNGAPGAQCGPPSSNFASGAPPPDESPGPVPTVVLIAIYLLLSEDSTRLERDEEHINALEADFRQRMLEKPGEHPVTTPLRVIRRGEKYLIVAGNNRYQAALRAGIRDLPCIILPGDLDEADLLIEQAKDNELRQGYSPLERARNIVRLQQLRGVSQAAACRLLGINSSDGSKWLLVLKGYPEDLHAHLGERDGQVPISVAYQLSRLKDEGKIRDLTAKVIGGLLTRDSVEGIVSRELKTGRKPKPANPVRIVYGNVTISITGDPTEALNGLKALHAKLPEVFRRIERDPALADVLPALLISNACQGKT